ncbi:hypothetical protein DEO72_LG1g2289 [Vigna unguiculata]|uniref:Uncharacterized protein n=1 Tax=Vigna unguiculata TaxID=3917 RepID=A0A4D6KQ73_VIGUN|nr:hypothetical protein DEO72_LG1g2289 [Vigna unguiculata]
MTRDGGCKMCGGAAVADRDGGSRWREVREWYSYGVVQWWPTRFRCVNVDEMMEVVGAVEMEKRGDDGARCLAVVKNGGGCQGGSWWRLGFEEN